MSLISPNFDVLSIIFPQFWPGAFSQIAGKSPESVKINKNSESKIVNIFIPISFNIHFGCSKNSLIETVLLSNLNICLN